MRINYSKKEMPDVEWLSKLRDLTANTIQLSESEIFQIGSMAEN